MGCCNSKQERKRAEQLPDKLVPGSRRNSLTDKGPAVEEAEELAAAVHATLKEDFIGILEVSSMKADLAELKLNSKHDDAFVVITVGTTTFKTTVRQNTRTPSWEEVCVVPVPAPDSAYAAPAMRVALWDKET